MAETVGWLILGYTLLILVLMSALVHYENRAWFRDWYLWALVVIGGPGIWLIVFLWWIRSRMEI